MKRRFVQQLPGWDEFSEIDTDTGMIVGYRVGKEGVRHGEYSHDIFGLGWTSAAEFIEKRRSKAWGWTELATVSAPTGW